MRRLLLVVSDSPASTRESAAAAIELYRREPLVLHLLSVQPSVSGHVAMYFQGAELKQIQRAAGAEELAPAQAMMEAAGVRCTTRVSIGRRAETIARAADELGCDRIMVAGDRDRSVAGKLLGSLAQQVRHLVGGQGGCQVIGS